MVYKVKPIVLDSIGVDSVLLDLAVPEIFYLKHNEVSSPTIFIGNPNVDSLSVVSDAIPVINHSNAATRPVH